MISQESFIRAWENKGLVAGALKAANVRRDYINYEDLFHDGLILYGELIEKWNNKAQNEINKLAFRKIIWQTIDSLRKYQKYDNNCTNLDDAFNLSRDEINWDNLVILKEEVKKMNETELLIFFEHLLANRSITEIVHECTLSRRTLQRIKKELLIRLKIKMQSWWGGRKNCIIYKVEKLQKRKKPTLMGFFL